uniref:5 aminolevulinate synthase n=1 Tax=Echinococcus granulosus TaxID=6210 RepID=A0A068X0W6_ECHGR|nr:5 aminolevulinate synthase [Echinococcus granulosus]
MMVMKEEINVGFTTLKLALDVLPDCFKLLAASLRLLLSTRGSTGSTDTRLCLDGLEKCGLGQHPRSVESDNLRHQNERKDCGSPCSAQLHLSFGGGAFTPSTNVCCLGCGSVVRASVAILKSAKGRDLRAEQRRCASLVLRRLQVGNAEVCTSISGALLFNHQIYLQSINYPTVAKGSELLCLTPSSSTPTQ